MKDKTPRDTAVAELADAIVHADNKQTIARVTAALETIASENIEDVEIITAVPLSKEQLVSLTSALKGRIAPAAHIQTTVDAALIGGFRVQVGNWLLDASVASEIALMKKTLLGN